MKPEAHAPPNSGWLAEIFSSQVRADVLGWMFARKDAGHSLTELARSLELAVSSVQHEVYKLERMGVLVARREGASRRYRLSIDEPLTRALEHLVLTANGIGPSVRAALAETPGLAWSTVASAGDDGDPGIVLVLVGDLDLADLAAIQERIASIFDVPVSRVATSFFSADTWRAHQSDDHALVQRLKTLKTLAVYGEIA